MASLTRTWVCLWVNLNGAGSGDAEAVNFPGLREVGGLSEALEDRFLVLDFFFVDGCMSTLS